MITKINGVCSICETLCEYRSVFFWTQKYIWLDKNLIIPINIFNHSSQTQSSTSVSFVPELIIVWYYSHRSADDVIRVLCSLPIRYTTNNKSPTQHWRCGNHRKRMDHEYADACRTCVCERVQFVRICERRWSIVVSHLREFQQHSVAESLTDTIYCIYCWT